MAYNDGRIYVAFSTGFGEKYTIELDVLRKYLMKAQVWYSYSRLDRSVGINRLLVQRSWP